MVISDRQKNSSDSEIIDNNPFFSQTNQQIFYIAESEGEFIAVEQDKDSNNLKTVPLNTIKYQTQKSLKLEQTHENQITQTVSKTKSSSSKSILVAGMGLGLLTALGVNYLFNNIPTKKSVVAASENGVISKATAKTVTVVEVTSDRIEKTLEVSGSVHAYELIHVMTPATGLQITTVVAEEGNFVSQGQVLAKLNDSQLQAELIQAKATVRQAEARLAELEAGARSEEIARAREQVISAKATVSQAESELSLVQKRVQRNRSLKQEGAISLDRLDEILNQEKSSRANLDQAKARLAEAKQKLAELETGVRPEVIAQARAEVSQARGRVQYIEARIQDTIVTAPVSGIVATRDARIGEIPASSTTLFSIIENGKLELRLEVPETLIGAIRSQQKVRILDTNINGEYAIATVREIAPIIDEESRKGIVKVDLPPNINVKSGMFVRAEIVTSQNPGKTLPTKALLPQADGSAIAFVLQQDNRVKAKSVEIGSILPNDYVEVLNGLATGDRIILQGAAYLKDGDLVKVSQDITN